MWEVNVTDEFREWFLGLSARQQEAVEDAVDTLEERGPTLGRPLVDRLEGSRHHNMKELRASADGVLRVLFAFDPRRQAILLLGGDKRGRWNAWYREAIPRADALYDAYLADLRREGLIP